METIHRYIQSCCYLSIVFVGVGVEQQPEQLVPVSKSHPQLES